MPTLRGPDLPDLRGVLLEHLLPWCRSVIWILWPGTNGRRRADRLTRLPTLTLPPEAPLSRSLSFAASAGRGRAPRRPAWLGLRGAVRRPRRDRCSSCAGARRRALESPSERQPRAATRIEAVSRRGIVPCPGGATPRTAGRDPPAASGRGQERERDRVVDRVERDRRPERAGPLVEPARAGRRRPRAGARRARCRPGEVEEARRTGPRSAPAARTAPAAAARRREARGRRSPREIGATAITIRIPGHDRADDALVEAELVGDVLLLGLERERESRSRDADEAEEGERPAGSSAGPGGRRRPSSRHGATALRARRRANATPTQRERRARACEREASRPAPRVPGRRHRDARPPTITTSSEHRARQHRRRAPAARRRALPRRAARLLLKLGSGSAGRRRRVAGADDSARVTQASFKSRRDLGQRGDVAAARRGRAAAPGSRRPGARDVLFGRVADVERLGGADSRRARARPRRSPGRACGRRPRRR